jgi:hypothetical protein
MPPAWSPRGGGNWDHFPVTTVVHGEGVASTSDGSRRQRAPHRVARSKLGPVCDVRARHGRSSRDAGRGQRSTSPHEETLRRRHHRGPDTSAPWRCGDLGHRGREAITLLRSPDPRVHDLSDVAYGGFVAHQLGPNPSKDPFRSQRYHGESRVSLGPKRVFRGLVLVRVCATGSGGESHTGRVDLDAEA